MIQDVVYNHFDPDADASRMAVRLDRAGSRTSTTGTRASSSDYPTRHGGYLDNGSTGFAPRYWEETVRQIFISSAAQLVEEFHVDGLRVDLTQAIHRDNALHADGRGVAARQPVRPEAAARVEPDAAD